MRYLDGGAAPLHAGRYARDTLRMRYPRDVHVARRAVGAQASALPTVSPSTAMRSGAASDTRAWSALAATPIRVAILTSTPR
jgi:hypothetical protein